MILYFPMLVLSLVLPCLQFQLSHLTWISFSDFLTAFFFPLQLSIFLRILSQGCVLSAMDLVSSGTDTCMDFWTEGVPLYFSTEMKVTGEMRKGISLQWSPVKPIALSTSCSSLFLSLSYKKTLSFSLWCTIIHFCHKSLHFLEHFNQSISIWIKANLN